MTNDLNIKAMKRTDLKTNTEKSEFQQEVFKSGVPSDLKETNNTFQMKMREFHTILICYEHI